MNKLWGLVGAMVVSVCLFRSCAEVSHPLSYETVGVVGIRQPDDITCGPSCVAMVAGWYGHKISVMEGLTLPEYVEGALSRVGVPSSVRVGGLRNLKHYVSEGRLPVVLLRSGDDTWHYVVVTGYTEGEVICMDPDRGRRIKLSVDHFMSSWEFRSDMDGIICGLVCPLCGGSGRYDWGVSCDLCNGDCVIDPLRALLREAGVRPRTMIVPDHSR